MNLKNKLFFSLILATTISPIICMQRIRNQRAGLNLLTRNSKNLLQTTRTNNFHNSAILKEEVNNLTAQELKEVKKNFSAQRNKFFEMYLNARKEIKAFNDLSILPVAELIIEDNVTGIQRSSRNDSAVAFKQFSDGCDYFFEALKEGEKAQKRKFGIIAGLGLLGTVGGIAIGWHLKSHFNDSNEK